MTIDELMNRVWKVRYTLRGEFLYPPDFRPADWKVIMNPTDFAEVTAEADRRVADWASPFWPSGEPGSRVGPPPTVFGIPTEADPCVPRDRIFLRREVEA